MNQPSAPGPLPRTSSVLFVCTGNICRSPMGERILAARAGETVSSASAGVGARNGVPMHPLSAEVLTGHGYQTGEFKSRYLRPLILQNSDRVLCMTRAHRAAAQQLLPARWKRVFTLTEFTDLAADQPLEEVIASRSRNDPNAERLDILDPMGMPKNEFERVFGEIEPKVIALADWIAKHPTAAPVDGLGTR